MEGVPCARSAFSQLLQRCSNIGHRLKAMRGLFRQASLYDLRRGRLQGRRLIVHHGVQRIEQRLAFEDAPARAQLIQHSAETEDIRSRIDRLPQRLLWRHVGRRADHCPRDRAGGVVGRVNRHLGQPEVEQFRAVARHHDVGRLQIAMEDAFAVCDVQRVHDLRGHAQRLVEG